MVRPRRSSAASDESGGTARDQVRCALENLVKDTDWDVGIRKHVRLLGKDHSVRS